MANKVTNRVDDIRKERGLSAGYLADKIGTTNTQMTRIKNGGLNEVWALKLAKVLQVQPGDLMPIITDGSVPLPDGLSQMDKSLLAAAMARFMEIHATVDEKTAQHLGMAAVKFFLMLRSRVKGQPDFDLADLLNTAPPGENT